MWSGLSYFLDAYSHLEVKQMSYVDNKIEHGAGKLIEKTEVCI